MLYYCIYIYILIISLIFIFIYLYYFYSISFNIYIHITSLFNLGKRFFCICAIWITVIRLVLEHEPIAWDEVLTSVPGPVQKSVLNQFRPKREGILVSACISNFYILLIWFILCKRIQGGGLMKEQIKYQRVWCLQRLCHFSKLLDLPKSVTWGPWNKPWTRKRQWGTLMSAEISKARVITLRWWPALFALSGIQAESGCIGWYRMWGPSQLWSCSKKRLWKQEPFPMLQVSMPSMPIEFAYEDILD